MNQEQFLAALVAIADYHGTPKSVWTPTSLPQDWAARTPEELYYRHFPQCRHPGPTLMQLILDGAASKDELYPFTVSSLKFFAQQRRQE